MHSRTPIAALVGAAVLGVSWWRASHPRVDELERDAMRFVNRQDDRLHLPLAAVMQFGSLGGSWATGAVVAALGHRRRGAAVATAGTATWLAAKGVKRATGRGRPADHLDGIRIRGGPQRGLGFPSGHAAVAMCTAAVAGPALAPPARGALYAATAVTGFARIYVGAHLPLDVVGGAGLGAAVGFTARALSA